MKHLELSEDERARFVRWVCSTHIRAHGCEHREFCG